MQHRGLTLVECLLASVILAFAVVAVSQAVVAGQMQTADALHRARALELAEALMDEVVRLRYDDPDGPSAPGPEPGETGRSDFDNADDFHGFSEAAGTLSDASGDPYDPSLPHQKFSRSVSVVDSGIIVLDFDPDALPGLFITVTVTVQDTAGATWTLTRFKAQPPS